MGWDYIIIGAGSAGCALAHELANGRPNESILVLEAGGSDSSPYIRFAGAGATRTMQDHDWGYRTQPDPTCNGATEAWTRGKVLGGCSSVNSTAFVRGAAKDFDRWDEYLRQNEPSRWSAADVLPIYKDYETSDRPGALRGRSGPLYVRTVKDVHPLTEAFLQSARAAGHAFNDDYNGETQEGVSYIQLSQRKGLRCSAADAFLKPLLGKKKNLRLVLNALVQKIELKDGRATAVSFMEKGALRREEGGQIIVSGGAINSPQLLMLSGIGDPAELKRHNIDVLVDLPGVGRNLQEHPSLRLLYKTKVPSNNLTEGWFQKLAIAGKFLTTRQGPITSPFEGIGFLKTQPSEAFPDVQIHFAPVGWFDSRASTALAPFPSVAVVVNKSHPLGRGQIRLASADPKDAPLIECRLLGDDADVETLVRGLEMIRKIMRSNPIADLIDDEIVAGSGITDWAEMKAWVRDNAKTTYHPSGTCRMGTGEDAVVGPDLRVRGVENLWVADASIMPDLISGNTNAVCIMIGKKCGKHIMARH